MNRVFSLRFAFPRTDYEGTPLADIMEDVAELGIIL